MNAAVGSNYASPVTVNGYPCWNCTDVERAKKFVDPAARSDGTGTRPAVSAADRAAGLGRLVDRLV